MGGQRLAHDPLASWLTSARRRFGQLSVAAALVGSGYVAGSVLQRPDTVRELRPYDAELDAAIEALETDVTQGRALVASQELMKIRHQQVTEVACASVQEHWEDMARLAQRQERRLAMWKAERAAARAPGRRLAQATTKRAARPEPALHSPDGVGGGGETAAAIGSDPATLEPDPSTFEPDSSALEPEPDVEH